MEPNERARERTLTRQLLLVAGLLLGVLLMHGVSADHAMPMTSAATMSQSGGDGATTGHRDAPVHPERLAVLMGPMEQHSLLAMCVAILASGFTLSVIVVIRLTRRGKGGRLRSPTVGAMASKAAKARWLTTPSLTRLCVSRT